MSDDDQPESRVDTLTGPEQAAETALAASSLGPLSHRQESIAQMLVEDANLEKLTYFFWRDEHLVHAKMQYLLALTKAVGASDKDGGFHFPDFNSNLLKRDYQLRTSYKQATRKILESITKIFERGAGESGRRGWLGGRK